MTTATEDLAGIVSKLDSDLARNREQLGQLQGELQEQQEKLTQVQHSKATTEASLQQWREFASRAEHDVHVASEDLQMCRGTSLEGEKKRALASAKEQLTKAQNELQALTANLETDQRQEQALVEQVQVLQHKIAEIAGVNDGLMAASNRWSGEHCESVKSASLDQVAAVDNELLIAEATLASIRARRENVVRNLAKDLAPWPEVCVSTLAQVGRFDDPPDAKLLSAKLAVIEMLEAKWGDISDEAKRLASAPLPFDGLRAYGGLKGYHEAFERVKVAHGANGGIPIADAYMQKFEDGVIAMHHLLDDLRRVNQQLQAARLLRELQQEG